MNRQDQINKAYERFGIPMNQIPDYTNAEEFSQNFEKCSILRDVNVSYSTSSTYNNLQYKK
ncbi:MAG: hypothetical protein NC238_03090 [Dehalobacter sp.]|nr:hypothetical protein [Dehalobacter sp.]